MEDADTPATPKKPERKYLHLLIALIGFVLLQMSTPHLVFVDLVFIVVLLATIRAMKGHRVAVYLAVGLVVTFWASSGVRVAFGDHFAISVLDDLLVTVLMTLVALVILGDVLRGSTITTDKIYGAICSYLLIAMGWASLYSAVGLLIPDAFRFPGQAPDLTAAGDGTMVYFSFVTLTTLGYGDILPVHRLARALCWMEAAFGQIYLAVLIAKIVSQHQSTRKHS
jgi:voltage-gated potassium channel